LQHPVQLFVTCLGEQFYPNVLQQMVAILERLGFTVEFPAAQTCCGQPLYNGGFQDQARGVARGFLHAFGEGDTPIVSPSGACVDMVRHHFLELFPPGSAEHELARAMAGRTFEFSEYLVRKLGITDVGARFPHQVAYHASCHHLRGLGLATEAKQLLAAVKDIELVPLPEEETCCGFGGVFSVVYPEVSRAMMQAKVRNIIGTGAAAVVACDAGCLMNIAGGLRQAGSQVRAMHLIEVLASQGSAR
jgi:L-lactate dehydrogenase complex protein LldE